MKKRFLTLILSITSILMCIFGLVSCGKKEDNSNNAPVHTEHLFNQMVIEDKYIATDATCSAPATYYFSCTCGQKGAETFEHGGAKSHNIVNGSCSFCKKGESQGLEFVENEDNSHYVLVSLGKNEDKDIIIPGSYNGKPVKEIKAEAFQDVHWITSIYIPSSISIISEGAFYNCENLTSITIPNSIKEIKSTAFYSCDKLMKVNFIGTIDEWAQIQFGYSESSYRNYMGNPLQYAHNLYINDVLVEDIVISNVDKISDFAFDNCDSITSVTIKDKTTHIGEWAFDNCDNLKEVKIGNGVVEIAKGAFAGNDNLTNVKLGNSLKTIGVSAFNGCDKLISINIPNSVETVDEWAFSSCVNLTSITIPSSVKVINKYAFTYSNALIIYCEIDVKPSDWNDKWNLVWGNDSSPNLPVIWNFNNNDTAEDGNIYIIKDDVKYSLKNEKATVCGGYGNGYTSQVSNLTNVKIAKNIAYKGKTYPVKSIGDSAFEGHNINKVDIESGLTSIGKKSFSECKNLSAINIPNSLTSIGDYAFSSCTGLTNVTIPESVAIVGTRAFYGCSALTIYCACSTKPEGWDNNWISDSQPIVWNCDKTDTATNGYIYTTIDNVRYGIKDGEAIVVQQPKNLTSVNIPTTISYKNETFTVTRIRDSAFTGHANLQSITFDINSRIKEIGADAFYDCDNLKTIKLPNSVEKLGSGAFNHCNILENIGFGKEIKEIGSFCFSQCDNLLKINYSGSIDEWVQISFGNGWMSSPTYNYSWNLYINGIIVRDVTISNASKISDYAFYECSSIETCMISSSTIDIGVNAFLEAHNFQSIKLDVAHPLYCSQDGILYNKDKTQIVFVPKGIVGSIIIPNSITTIKNGLFNDCGDLTSIKLPIGITSIEENAFSGCNALTIYCEISAKPSGWHNNWNVYHEKQQYSYKFYKYCPVVWDCNNNDVADDGYIYTCINGIVYTIKDNVARVAHGRINDGYVIGGGQPINTTFANIASSVSYKGEAYTVVGIGQYAFQACEDLTGVVIPVAVTEIYQYTFRYCDNLKDIYYMGTKDEWNELNIVNDPYGNSPFKSCTIYYYIEDENNLPKDGGNYWHYGENNKIIVWSFPQ